ncbi:hypothetical protein TCAL_10919 [Tigriopus californicus]|uniref:Integrase catalytic domain-containing protein n=1 Tax=Tigriopus californicus TaxID=6832 RepID=A0A553PQ75_TIGCA|nr:hypothetical protein TCAL_10919 [Tigriopus californicus]
MVKVSIDLFDLGGQSFLVLIDRYSGYPFVAHLKVTTTSAVCLTLLGWFWENGFPAHIKSDNADGYSPAFAFFGRHLRGLLPDVRPSPQPPLGFAEARSRSRTTSI